jgi:hypothetical protein
MDRGPCQSVCGNCTLRSKMRCFFRIRSCAAACFVVLAAVRVDAQVLRGSVVGADGSTIVAGAVVALVDSTGTTVARTLSDDRGTFRVVAPRAGTYRVRTLHVGSRPSMSEPLVLAAGASVTQTVRTGGVIRLSAVMVAGSSDCRIRPDSSQRAFAAWEAARTALLATTLAAEDTTLTMWLRRRRESVDTDARELLHSELDERRVRAKQSFVSIGVDALSSGGYVVRDSAGLVYHAPDASVLLSEQFADTHCLRPAPSDDAHRALVGVEFMPVNVPRERTDVRGTFWLDSASSELRSIEFRYTNLPGVAERAGAGGTVRLTKLPGGRWIVRDWQLRMPVFDIEEAPRAAGSLSTAAPRMPRVRLRSIDIATAEVLTATVDTTIVLDMRTAAYVSPYRPAAPRDPVIVGTVTDSAGAPLAGVELTLAAADSDRMRVSDERGRFAPIAVPRGTDTAYTVSARKLGYGFARQSVSLGGVDTLTLEIVLPRLRGVTVLAPVTVVDRKVPSYLAHFERNRRGYGFFLTPEQLKALPRDAGLGDAVAARWPGAAATRYMGKLWLQQKRGVTGDPIHNTLGEPADINSPRGCWTQLIVDGVRVYSARFNRGDAAPDLNYYRTGHVAAVEFYPNASTTPPEYGGAMADCGTLVLWTR